MIVDQIAFGVETPKNLWDAFVKNDKIDENSFINHGGRAISHGLMREGGPHILLYTDHKNFGLTEDEVVCRIYDTVNNSRGNKVVLTTDDISKFDDYQIIYEMNIDIGNVKTGQVSMGQINNLLEQIHSLGDVLDTMDFMSKTLFGSYMASAIVNNKEKPWYKVYVQLTEAIKDGDCALELYFPTNSKFVDEYGGRNQDDLVDRSNKIPHIRLDKHITHFDHSNITGFTNDDSLRDHSQYKDSHTTNFCEIVDFKSRYVGKTHPKPRIDVDNFLYNAENLQMAIEEGMVIDKITDEKVPFLSDGLDKISVIYNIHEHFNKEKVPEDIREKIEKLERLESDIKNLSDYGNYDNYIREHGNSFTDDTSTLRNVSQPVMQSDGTIKNFHFWKKEYLSSDGDYEKVTVCVPQLEHEDSFAARDSNKLKCIDLTFPLSRMCSKNTIFGCHEFASDFNVLKYDKQEEYKKIYNELKTESQSHYSKEHSGAVWYKDLDSEIRKEFIESFFDDACQYGPIDDLDYTINLDQSALELN